MFKVFLNKKMSDRNEGSSNDNCDVIIASVFE